MLWGQVWFTWFLCGTGRGCDRYSGAGRKEQPNNGESYCETFTHDPSIHRNARIIPQNECISEVEMGSAAAEFHSQDVIG